MKSKREHTTDLLEVQYPTPKEEIKSVERMLEEIAGRVETLEKHLDELMDMLKHHAYVGVPDQFRAITGMLIKIAEKLGVKE